MFDIFNFFGSILGYLLWWLYLLFKNYGVAILFFTIITKLIMFPFTLKQQKSMASQSKVSAKSAELQKKYGSDRQKYAEEVQKLYDKEGVSMSSGCLTSLIPFPIMLGIFYSVTNPLSNTLHIAKETVSLAIQYVQRIPGVLATGGYAELEVVRNFAFLKDKLTMFNGDEISKIDSFSNGFNFFGIDLLMAPQDNPFSLMIIIPIISLVFSYASQFLMSKTNKTQTQGPGCMKVMMYAMPLLSVYWSYIMPAAVGLYWGFSAVVSFVQQLLTNKFFSANHLVARSEAARVASLEIGESNLRPLSAADQARIAMKLEAVAVSGGSQKTNKAKNTGKNKSRGNSKGTSNYLGKSK